MTFITHGFPVSVVSDVRKRVWGLVSPLRFIKNEFDWMRLDSTLKKSSPIYLGPKNLDTILMHWMSVKLTNNFQEGLRFSITFALYQVYVKKIFISRVCKCATLNMFTMCRKKKYPSVWLALWLQRSWLKCEKLTDGRTTDDGRSVVTIAHLTLWVRWANKGLHRGAKNRKKGGWNFNCSLLL
jgi:hypothetical protein